MYKQYSIAGLNKNNDKWYREGRFMNIEGAKHYFKHNRNKFKGYAKIKLQSRYITEWVDEKELNWKE